MSDAPANAPAAGTTDGTGSGDENGQKAAPTVEELTAQLEEWKGHARKHEDKAKANAKAATELAELKRSTMSDAEKAAADREAASTALQEATDRADKAEAALTRYKLAVELELSQEDAAALENVQGDEKTLRALAERLAGRKSTPPKPTRTQGLSGNDKPTTADLFAAAMEDLF